MFVIAGNMKCMKCICGKKIAASSIVNQEKKDPDCCHVHKDCLVCPTCGKSLGDRKWCFMHKGNSYCDIQCLRVKHHPKQSVCYNCKESLTGDTQVIKIRGHIYHPFCLRCAQCGIQLKSGRRYSLNKDKDIVCLTHACSEDVNEIEGTKENTRTRITEKQRLSLLYHYTKCRYPNSNLRHQIARKLKLEPAVVKVWFQNNRARNKNARTCTRVLEDYE